MVGKVVARITYTAGQVSAPSHGLKREGGRSDRVRQMPKSRTGSTATRSVQVSRRSFLSAAAVAGYWSMPRRGRGQTSFDPASIEARRKAAWRRRPLILDDDGDLVYAEETNRGPAEFLALRMHDCRAAGVNSLAWCMMWGVARKRKAAARYWQTQQQGIPFQPNMPDPTPVITKFCHENEMEVCGSVRMNDCHDGYGLPFSKLIYPLKVAHPEMLIGAEAQRGAVTDGLAAAMWSGLDYAHPQVREDRLWWIENSARQYDLDGVDLNFFRMPWCFKFGEEEKNTPLMTEFIRQARRRLDTVSRQRGRTILLGVRVPGTVETCRRIGFDIEGWLREGLIDRLLTGGGYVCYSTPAEELVKLGHRFEVPVYPCINCPANYTLGGDNLRAAAANLWWAGADGIYLWNFQYIPAPGSRGYGRPAPEQYQRHLTEIGDPQRLKYLDKSFAVSQRVWEQYQRASAPAPLPVDLGRRVGEVTRVIPIRIGDDIPAAQRSGKLRDVVLRMQIAGSVQGDTLAVKLGAAAAEVTESRSKNRYELALHPGAIVQGVNDLKLEIARRGPAARQELAVERINIDVRYHPA